VKWKYVHPFSLSELRGSFQKFCTLYVFSLKMNLFYKIHLQAFNVISTVFYHSGPTFGQVLYSCLDDFVFYAFDCSGHPIRHLLSASEAFPTEWFLRNKSKSGGLSPPDFDLVRRNHSVGNASEALRRCLMG
jgi:homogentisate 1,2-dioxygenase